MKRHPLRPQLDVIRREPLLTPQVLDPGFIDEILDIPPWQLRARNRLAGWGVWLGKTGRRSTFPSLLVIPVVFTYVDDGMALVGRLLRRKGRGVQAA